MGRGRSQKSIDLVAAARAILEEIQPCSVRAVCYQLFVRGVITGMEKANTNRVGALLTRAREEGEISWERIVQEGREIEGEPSWDSPADFARTVQRSYRLNKWAGQPKRIIVGRRLSMILRHRRGAFSVAPRCPPPASAAAG